MEKLYLQDGKDKENIAVSAKSKDKLRLISKKYILENNEKVSKAIENILQVGLKTRILKKKK